MSRKHSKHKKKKPHSNPHQNSRDTNPEENMDVGEKIEISRSPALEQQHNAERKQDNAHQQKTYIVSVITMVFVIIYSFLTFFMYCANKKAADAAKNAADTAA